MEDLQHQKVASESLLEFSFQLSHNILFISYFLKTYKFLSNQSHSVPKLYYIRAIFYDKEKGCISFQWSRSFFYWEPLKVGTTDNPVNS